MKIGFIISGVLLLICAFFNNIQNEALASTFAGLWIFETIGTVVYGIAKYLHDKNDNRMRKSGDSSSNDDGQIPTRLKGIHPDADSFWNTEEFYARLGEECSKITDNRFSLSLDVRPGGSFSVLCSFIDSAQVFFPALGSDLQVSFSGNDSQIERFYYTAQKIVEIIQEDAPSAHIKSYEGIDGKSFSVVWNPNNLP